MEDKLNFLLNDANIGIYNKCEIIEIFGFDKEKKQAFNIYTLIIFENTKQIDIEGLMTEKLQKFEGFKKISWGIQRRVIELDRIEKLYSNLLKINEYKIDKPLSIGDLKLLPEQYIPARESNHKEIQLNNTLKNNFHNGSYILEFFDEEKENVRFLLENPELLNKFSESVSSILPIKIGTLSDRLGNVVFQLSINAIDIHHESIVDRTLRYPKFQGFKIEILPKIERFNIENLIIRIYEENESITRQKFEFVKNEITEIYLDDSFGTYIEIIAIDTQLLLYRFRVYLMKQAYISSNVIEHQDRVFEIGDKKEKLQISTNAISNVLGKVKEKPFNEWISNRIYAEQLKELEKSKSFIQYFGNEEDKALQDIRELINKHGERGVYIWDPYLSANDIKNTLYYSKINHVPLRAITGLKHGSINKKTIFKKELFDFQLSINKLFKKSKKQQSIDDMIKEFEKDKKEFLFLDLEVRGKIGSNGYDFHDRFLIFPLEQPKVWSLGISVNQLGASHHILQEVKNAQHILNAFNQLWNELDSEECLVWKSK